MCKSNQHRAKVTITGGWGGGMAFSLSCLNDLGMCHQPWAPYSAGTLWLEGWGLRRCEDQLGLGGSFQGSFKTMHFPCGRIPVPTSHIKGCVEVLTMGWHCPSATGVHKQPHCNFSLNLGT